MSDTENDTDERSPRAGARIAAAVVGLLALGGGGVAVWASSGTDAPSPADTPDAAPAPADDPHTLDLPPRPEGAPTGSALLDELADKDLDEVESRVLEEIRSGNVPPFLRDLVAVDVQDDGGATDTVWVLRDYLSVGSDDDYVRVPLRARAAEELAEEFGAVLPTPRIVEAVHRAADVRLPPRSDVGDPTLHWIAQTRIHDHHVDEQLDARGGETGSLVAGHMKDLVISPAVAAHPGKVAIYGMHHPDGEPAQPLSTFHDDTYVDYSHGIRLVANGAKHHGEAMGVTTILSSKEHHAILSPAGTIEFPAYR